MAYIHRSCCFNRLPSFLQFTGLTNQLSKHRPSHRNQRSRAKSRIKHKIQRQSKDKVEIPQHIITSVFFAALRVSKLTKDKEINRKTQRKHTRRFNPTIDISLMINVNKKYYHCYPWLTFLISTNSDLTNSSWRLGVFLLRLARLRSANSCSVV